MISAEKNFNIEKYSPKNGYLKAEDKGKYNTDDVSQKRLHRLLTQKEKDLVTLMGYGHTAGEIGQKLNLKIRTIDNKIYKLKKEFEATTRAQLVWIILRNGLLKIETKRERYETISNDNISLAYTM